MTTAFLTIAEAVQLTGKSRRTIQRLVQTLAKEQPDQVMQEKTSRGYIWKISEQSVQKAYGVNQPAANGVSSISQHQASAPPVSNIQAEKYLEVVGQGYSGMMAMHQEVKQIYEKRLRDKDERIDALTQELQQAQRGFWGRLFGG
jgi:predicted DNA-binding transcriptional regulator AlpA